jgi:aminopeptidase N
MQAQNGLPNRADTLRGTLSHYRTCFDVKHYDLTVSLDTLSQTIWGENTITFLSVEDFTTLQIDLFDNMVVSNISCENQTLSYHREFNAIFIDMHRSVRAGEILKLTIKYFGKPIIANNPPWDGGFVWTRSSNNQPWITVSCQGIGASLWWPCKDHLSDEPDSMDIHCQVPKELMCVANGQDRGIDYDAEGRKTCHWHVSYPINNYNVSLNIGDYVHFSDIYTSPDGSQLPLDYYVIRGNEHKAEKQFKQVKPMLKCYEEFLGKYPFWNDGYALVETPYAGMEHQGAIAYGNKYKTGYLGSDMSGQNLKFDYIIIHETGHEWWGNSVSAADIADMWIHESFCTYSEAIYVECMHGYDTAMTYVNALRGRVQNKAAIMGPYGINREGHYDMYVKGMLFLNTLRHVVNNDSIWWPTIKSMCDTAFKYSTTDYKNVVAFFNQKTGLTLDPIFEQYVKHYKLPTLEYNIKKTKRGTSTLLRWKAETENFHMPIICIVDGIPHHMNISDQWIRVKSNAPLEFDSKHFYYDLRKEKRTRN